MNSDSSDYKNQNNNMFNEESSNGQFTQNNQNNNFGGQYLTNSQNNFNLPNFMNSVDNNLVDGDYSAIPGEPGKDYPILSEIPRTSFNCKDRNSGFYADVETQCQVFHRCVDQIQYDFLCPNGTIFHQRYLVCVWWPMFECETATSLYDLFGQFTDDAITNNVQDGRQGMFERSQDSFNLNQGQFSLQPQQGETPNTANNLLDNRNIGYDFPTSGNPSTINYNNDNNYNSPQNNKKSGYLSGQRGHRDRNDLSISNIILNSNIGHLSSTSEASSYNNRLQNDFETNDLSPPAQDDVDKSSSNNLYLPPNIQ